MHWTLPSGVRPWGGTLGPYSDDGAASVSIIQFFNTFRLHRINSGFVSAFYADSDLIKTRNCESHIKTFSFLFPLFSPTYSERFFPCIYLYICGQHLDEKVEERFLAVLDQKVLVECCWQTRSNAETSWLHCTCEMFEVHFTGQCRVRDTYSRERVENDNTIVKKIQYDESHTLPIVRTNVNRTNCWVEKGLTAEWSSWRPQCPAGYKSSDIVMPSCLYNKFSRRYL